MYFQTLVKQLKTNLFPNKYKLNTSYLLSEKDKETIMKRIKSEENFHKIQLPWIL
mgnify:FL=1